MQLRRTFQYRLYPTPAQEHAFLAQLGACRTLYNDALTERREAYRLAHKSLNYYDQAAALRECRAIEPDLASVNYSATQDVLRRLDKAFQAFFRRVKTAQVPGYPRYKSRRRYNSIVWPSYGDGVKLREQGRLYVQNVGVVVFKAHRALAGQIKTVTIKREGPRWYVCFSCVVEIDPPAHNGTSVGIDVGLEYYASLSTGEQIANPRYFRRSARRLARAQRKHERTPKSSPNRRKSGKAVACAHRKIANQRADFQHKLSRRLAKQYSLICVEELGIVNMSRRALPKLDEARTTCSGVATYEHNGAAAKSGLSKSIQDAAWRAFTDMIAYKAEEAGGKLVRVAAAGTSKECPDCGSVVRKTLEERWHSCECGCSLPRDVASSRVILARGLASLGLVS